MGIRLQVRIVSHHRITWKNDGPGGGGLNLFKSYSLTWWQMGILKLALLAMGAVIGAYWHEFFGANLVLLVVIAAIAGAYIMYATLKQQ